MKGPAELTHNLAGWISVAHAFTNVQRMNEGENRRQPQARATKLPQASLSAEKPKKGNTNEQARTRHPS